MLLIFRVRTNTSVSLSAWKGMVMKIKNILLERQLLLYIVLVLFINFLPGHLYAQTNAEDTAPMDQILLERAFQSFKGDLPQIKKERVIRVLVSYSKSNYFFQGGHPKGFEYEMLKQYQKFINKNIKNHYDQVRILFIPTPFDKLLPQLAAGRGDIAAAGLTATIERKKHVAFSEPYISNVFEVAVLYKHVTGIQSVDDLSGKMVYVRSGSSYVAHLKALNRKLKSNGNAPIRIMEGDKNLTTEDILEMVNAGVIKITIADHHIAKAWATVLPDIVIRKDISINSRGEIAWAVRKEAPKLLSHLNTFIKKNKKGSLMGNILFKRYYENSKFIKNPITEKEREKLFQVISLFKKYSLNYGFDYLAIAAQAYQESGLDHSKRSHAGAIGIMQLLPGTASDKNVNIKDIKKLENNIHAGVKYMNFIRNRYFNDPAIEPSARVDFAWAAYNAGPARINQMRKIAAERGFDPNRWFFNVEKIAAEKIGRETVNYVANINKYFVAYRLLYDIDPKTRKFLDTIGGSGTKQKATQSHKANSTQILEKNEKTQEQVEAASNEKPAQEASKQKTKSQNGMYHVVKKGETLYRISRRYGISVQKIKNMNKLGRSNTIHPGDKIIIKP